MRALVLALLFGLSAVGLAAATAPATILFISGDPSHGPGEHRFPDGCRLLAGALNRAELPVRAEVSLGWPEAAQLDRATALVLYSDGLDRHVANGHVAALRRHTGTGRGLAVLHFAVEPSPGDLADYLLETIGGRFETDWSVNPLWTVREPTLPTHEVTRGVGPFTMEDEWYYHLRFRPGITPVLLAVPPPDTLGQDGPRSGNPAVRAAVARSEPQILGWVYEGAGVRTFGFTGGHFHRNWSDMNFRKLVLNALLWTASVAVPVSGVSSEVAAMPKYPSIDEAIARGDLADVKLHVNLQPASARTGKDAGLAPLHQAILRNRNEIALFLLDSGASPDTPDRSSRTPLHLAVERGNVALVQALMARKAKPNQLDKMGWTPLHHAAAKDRVAVARALLDGGADPKTVSERGGTPLHEAAASGSAEMVQLFLKAGVNPNIVSKLGVTALDIAREFKNEAAIAILTPLTTVKK
ncbi:MAG: ankyrin repeat domain-containing protein [Verrucomicrobia bacterium]|nr:ankyrin repeat domain-containing protein [Verrucomicrobiota bacterium]